MKCTTRVHQSRQNISEWNARMTVRLHCSQRRNCLITFQIIFRCNNVPTASRGRFIHRHHFQATRRNPDHPHPVQYLSTLRNHKCPCISCRFLRIHTCCFCIQTSCIYTTGTIYSNAPGAGFWFIRLIFSASVASSLYHPCLSGSGALTIGDNTDFQIKVT